MAIDQVDRTVITEASRLFESRQGRLMASQHVKGAVSTVMGNAKEVAGKITGDKRLEAKGKAQRVQGKAQGVVGDAMDAVRKDRHR